MFYSILDEVIINYNTETFSILEYINLGLQNTKKYYPFEETIIQFDDNANYSIETELVFEPPEYDKKSLFHVYNSNNSLLEKLNSGIALTKIEERDLINLPTTYLICHFNAFEDALDRLQASKNLLKKHSKKVYAQYKEAIRILRKIKYN